jgi:hypothetical protein
MERRRTVTTGFLDLRTHEDLFKKLEWEFAALSEEPTSSYRAYNFFVTGWHLLEWEHPDPSGKPIRQSIRNRTPLLQVCEHLAVGAKHFAPSSAKHQSVTGSKRTGVWGGSWGGSWGSAWGEELVVSLDGEAATQFGPSISVQELAQHVMQYWRNHFALKSSPSNDA